MAKTLIDIDDELLAEAADVLGTTTKKDTVNSALSEIVRRERVLHHVDRLKAGGLPDLADPEVMKHAWE